MKIPQTPEEKAAFLAKFTALRHRCRTDLLFLCNNVLNYKDIHHPVHTPILEKLQQFHGGTDEFAPDTGLFKGYTPKYPNPYDMPGARRRLFLDPRGFLKTTLITVAHKIQWIINYPNVRILICHATGERAKEILQEIKSHFQYNQLFREIFPEHCPSPKKAGDFGNQEQFTTLARTQKTLKEPTVQVSSIESTTAGTHQEVVDCSDIVEKENVRTPDRIRQIKASFAQLQFLLDEPARAWLDVEGTLYDYQDVYHTILDSEEKKEPEKRVWLIHRRGITEEIGNFDKPTWPKPAPGRSKCFPREAIEMIVNDPNMDKYTVLAQYWNVILSGENSCFPPEAFQWVPRDVIKAYCVRYHITVDLSDPDPVKGPSTTGDYSVICVAGFDAMNRMYVCDLSRGRYFPSDVIEEIFRLWDKYKALDVKIEDAAGARKIFPMLERERIRRNKWPILSLIKRDSRVAKQDRIMGLQPWFKARDIRFAEDLPWRDEMLMEFNRFPRYNHDDIADAIADQIQNRFTGPYKTEQEMLSEVTALKLPWFVAENPSWEQQGNEVFVDERTGV